MGFAQAVTGARTRRAQEQERSLRAHLEQHGVPEISDIGRVLAIRRQFPLVDDSTFARVLNEAQEPNMSLITGEGADVVKALISKP